MSSLSQINDVLIHISIFFNTKTIQNMKSLKLLLQTNKEINKIVLEESNYILFKDEIIFDNHNMYKYIDIYSKATYYYVTKDNRNLLYYSHGLSKTTKKENETIFLKYKEKIAKQIQFIPNKFLDIYNTQISFLYNNLHIYSNDEAWVLAKILQYIINTKNMVSLSILNYKIKYINNKSTINNINIEQFFLEWLQLKK
jgi:hypothetical protein